MLATPKSPLITVEVTPSTGQPVLNPSRSPSAVKAEAAKQMLLQQSRQMPCSLALGPDAAVGDSVLQVRHLLRWCLHWSEHATRLCAYGGSLWQPAEIVAGGLQLGHHQVSAHKSC